MVNGRIHLLHNPNISIELHRGMMILTHDGKEAGFSAGIVINEDEETVFVLLGRLPVTSEYRLIPIEHIDRINGENIHLSLNCDGVMDLQLYQSA